jgi:leucyl/phenylalanyl-tRNA--protein transferase
MFSTVTDSSKLALVVLCQQLQRWGIPLIDCQVYSDHLASLGAEQMARSDFIEQLDQLCLQRPRISCPGLWSLASDLPAIP